MRLSWRGENIRKNIAKARGFQAIESGKGLFHSEDTDWVKAQGEATYGVRKLSSFWKTWGKNK